jgi:prevent-host-death family protein
MTRTMTAQEARDNFGELLDSVHYTKEPVLVQKRGKPFAFVLSADEWQDFIDYRAAKAWERLDRIAAQNADMDPDDVLALVTEEVEAVRKERRERRAE